MAKSESVEADTLAKPAEVKVEEVDSSPLPSMPPLPPLPPPPPPPFELPSKVAQEIAAAEVEAEADILAGLPRVEYPLVEVKVGAKLDGSFDLQGATIAWPNPAGVVDRAGTRLNGHNVPTVLLPEVMYNGSYGSMKCAVLVKEPLVLIPIGSANTRDQLEAVRSHNHQVVMARLGQGDAVSTEYLSAKAWQAITT